jgi:hypothetical protein
LEPQKPGEAFGKYVAAELATMEPAMAREARMKIMEVINQIAQAGTPPHYFIISSDGTELTDVTESTDASEF